MFWTLDSGLYFIYFRKNTISLGEKLVTFFVRTIYLHFPFYMSGLVIGNAKWQAIFSVLFLNHLQHSPTRGWWPQTHLEAARAVILRCAGKTSQRALTALSLLILERKDKVKHFAYSIQLLVRSVLKSPLLICSFFHITAAFPSILAIHFFHHIAWRWRASFAEKPFEISSSGKRFGGKRWGRCCIYVHRWREGTDGVAGRS